MDFVTRFSQSADQRGDIYDLILVFYDLLAKIVYYELVQTTITEPAIAEVIFNIVI